MTEMFGEAWSPMSVPDLAPDDDDDDEHQDLILKLCSNSIAEIMCHKRPIPLLLVRVLRNTDKMACLWFTYYNKELKFLGAPSLSRTDL